MVAGTGVAGFNGDGLPAEETNLYLPSDVELAPDGRLVIVDYNNYRIRALDEEGLLVTIAGDGTHAYADEGAAALETPFENPIDVTFGPDDAMYIAAEHEGRVLRIGEAGIVEVVAGTGTLGMSGDGGDALVAQLSDPTGVIFVDGALYVSDYTNQRVRRVADGVIDTVVGGDGDEPAGPGTEVDLDGPQRIAYDASTGEVLVADSLHHRICAWDPLTGDVRDIAGTGEAGYAGDGGPAHSARLDTPQAAVAAPDGTIFVADSRNHVVRAIAPDGTLSTVVGTGLPGGGPEKPTAALETPLNYPAGLLLTEEGDLYIANMLGHQVLVFRGAVP